jgi:hypothetical protein
MMSPLFLVNLGNKIHLDYMTTRIKDYLALVLISQQLKGQLHLIIVFIA